MAYIGGTFVNTPVLASALLGRYRRSDNGRDRIGVTRQGQLVCCGAERDIHAAVHRVLRRVAVTGHDTSQVNTAHFEGLSR